jgi:hypothetical protein
MPAGTSLSKLWELASALPGSVVQDHHGRPSFRVGGRIYATVWDESHINLMLDEERILSLVRKAPAAFGEIWWGGRLRCVRIDLRSTRARLVGKLLREAWERRMAKPANPRKARNPL